MICRPDRILFAALAAAALVLPVQASADAQALERARQALARGDGLAAQVAAARALNGGAPKHAVAALLGEAALLQGDLPEARRWLGPMQFSAATAARGFHALARLEMQEGRLPEAAAAFDRAITFDPRNARIWVDIGSMRYLAGEHGLAVAAAQKAVALDGADPRVLVFRGLLLRDAHGARAALPWFRKALSLAPGDIELMGEVAATLGELGRNREMLALARQMVTVDPRHPRAYYLQAVLAARSGHNELARRLLWRTKGAYDSSPAGMMLSGVLELRSGNAALAVDKLDSLARRQPDNAVAAQLLGRALLASGEANELIARLEGHASSPGASPYLLTLVGRAHERLGQREMAARYLDRAADWQRTALALLPMGSGTGQVPHGLPATGAAGAVPLLRHLLATRQDQAAADVVVRLQGQFPGSADIDLLSGDAAMVMGNAREALAFYASAARIRRGRPLTLRMVAALRALGRPAEAADLLGHFAADHPMDHRTLALLGRMQFEQRDMAEAGKFLGAARSWEGGSRDPHLLVDLAQVQLNTGALREARQSAERAFALQRASGRVAATLVRTMKIGRRGDPAALALQAKIAALGQRPELAIR